MLRHGVAAALPCSACHPVGLARALVFVVVLAGLVGACGASTDATEPPLVTGDPPTARGPDHRRHGRRCQRHRGAGRAVARPACRRPRHHDHPDRDGRHQLRLRPPDRGVRARGIRGRRDPVRVRSSGPGTRRPTVPRRVASQRGRGLGHGDAAAVERGRRGGRGNAPDPRRGREPELADGRGPRAHGPTSRMP